jgi:hypothetical protein
MPKTIILCSDGTGNVATKGRGTNVFKLFETVDLNGHLTDFSLIPQVGIYDDGVGTHGTWMSRLIGQAFGVGIGANVKRLYRELSRIYEPGDRIFLFGFSRGAFTIRLVASLVGRCGILNGDQFETAGAFRTAVDDAYRAFRRQFVPLVLQYFIPRVGSNDPALRALHDKYAPHRGTVDFVGIWDSVDGANRFVNNYIYRIKSMDRRPGPHIRAAYHALSLDDARAAFLPQLWDEHVADSERIQQVWFSGVHSNVGGGYDKHGMSLVSLHWMLEHAQRAGLRLKPLAYESLRGAANVDDMLYDPRQGLGTLYRFVPRSIDRLCAQHSIQPKIHLSVAERIARGIDDYAPGNIPADSTVVFTPARDPRVDGSLRDRAAATQNVIRTVHGDKHQLLDDVRTEIVLYNAAHYVTIGSWCTLLVLAVQAVARYVPVSAARVVSIRPPEWLVWTTLVTLVAATWTGRRVLWRMSEKFSRFWRQHQSTLRAALQSSEQSTMAINEGESVHLI